MKVEVDPALTTWPGTTPNPSRMEFNHGIKFKYSVFYFALLAMVKEGLFYVVRAPVSIDCQ